MPGTKSNPPSRVGVRWSSNSRMGRMAGAVGTSRSDGPPINRRRNPIARSPWSHQMSAASTHGMHGYRAVGPDKRLPSASRGWRRAVDAETYNRGRATPFDRRGGDPGGAAVLDQANPDGRAGCVGSGAAAAPRATRGGS